MKKKRKQTMIATFLALTLLFILTACGSKEETVTGADGSAPADSGPEESPASAVLEDDSALSDGKVTSSAWKEGMIKVNGKTFNLSQTTLAQFTECGYNADDTEMNFILYGSKEVSLQDNKHQEIRLAVKNYSADKPLYKKNALICGYTVNYAVENGLEGADAILPGNIRGGMTKDEITSVLGTPDSDSSDRSLYYTYKENDRTPYKITLKLDYDTHTLESVDYRNDTEYANVTDDSEAIQNSLGNASTSSLTGKSTPSDVLKDAEIKIGSNVYTMPISMTDLSELGYSDDSLFDKVINPKETRNGGRMSDKGGNIIYARDLYNPSDQPCAGSHCMVCELAFNSDAENISIAKGIKIGSTYDEVCKAFGEKEKQDGYKNYQMKYTYSAKRGEVTIVFSLISKQIK